MDTNENSTPLPEVNIVIDGTITGVQTDFDRNYAIQVRHGEVLDFPFVGLEILCYPVGKP